MNDQRLLAILTVQNLEKVLMWDTVFRGVHDSAFISEAFLCDLKDPVCRHDMQIEIRLIRFFVARYE